MKKIILVVLLVVGLIPSTALAKEKKNFAQIYTDCGIGGIVGDAVGGGAGNVLAVVTNIVWDLGLTASSSALTTPESCMNNKALTAKLIHHGYGEIEKEIALGDGKYLKALAILNTPSSMTEDQYVSSLRNDFSAVVAKNDYTDATHLDKASSLFDIASK